MLQNGNPADVLMKFAQAHEVPMLVRLEARHCQLQIEAEVTKSRVKTSSHRTNSGADDDVSSLEMS